MFSITKFDLQYYSIMYRVLTVLEEVSTRQYTVALELDSTCILITPEPLTKEALGKLHPVILCLLYGPVHFQGPNE